MKNEKFTKNVYLAKTTALEIKINDPEESQFVLFFSAGSRREGGRSQRDLLL